MNAPVGYIRFTYPDSYWTEARTVVTIFCNTCNNNKSDPHPIGQLQPKRMIWNLRHFNLQVSTYGTNHRRNIPVCSKGRVGRHVLIHLH